MSGGKDGPGGGAEPAGLCRRSLLAAAFDETPERFELPGELGGFRPLRRIGHGASGEVWQAFQPGPDRTVALKVFLDPQLGGRADRSRFMAEAQSLGRLDHPAIVPVYAAGEDAGFLYIASRWMPGGTLDELKRGPDQPSRFPQRVAAVLATIAEAVEHAHRHGLVHRDIKPANILLDDEAQPWLADFGIAITAGEAEEGSTSGTPAYMAPEQARGEAVTTAADVFSLGAVMFDLLTGHPPRDAIAAEELAGVDPDLAAVCLKCLSREPAERYPSAGELAKDLRRWIGREPVMARPAGAGRRLAMWARRHPAVASLSALSVAAAVTLAVILLLGSEALRRERNRALDQEQRAVENASRAEETAEAFRQHAYAADIYLASRALDDGQLGVARAMLERHLPGAGEEDIRGFEWWAYRERCEGQEERVLAKHGATVMDVAFSPDSRFVVSVGRDEKLIVTEVASGKPALVLPQENAPSKAAEIPLMAALVAGSPELRDAILAGELNPDEVRMRGRPSRLGEQIAVAWSPDGGLLASSSSGAYVRLWEFPKGMLRALFPLRNALQMEFTDDGRRLLALESHGPGMRLHVYDVETRRRLRTVGEVDPGFAYRGGRLAWASEGVLHVEEEESGRELHRWEVGHSVGSMAFSEDGSCLAALAPDGRNQWVWRLEDGRRFSPREVPASALRDVVALGGGFVTAGARQTLVKRSATEFVVLGELRGHEGEVKTLAVSPDGRHVASGGVDRSVRLWRAERIGGAGSSRDEVLPTVVDFRPESGAWLSHSEDGRVFLQLGEAAPTTLGAEWPRQALGFDRSGERVATWREDGGEMVLEWWSVKTAGLLGERRLQVAADPPWVIDAANSRLVVGGQNSPVELFDLEDGRRLAVLPEPAHNPTRLSLSRDGSRVAVSSWPRYVQIGSFEAGWGVRFEATKGTMGPLVFSPDGRLVISGNDENAISIHDAVTGERLRSLVGHREKLMALAFTPDGRTLVSASADQTLRLWHGPTWRELGVLQRGTLANFLGFDAGGERLGVGHWRSAPRVIPAER